MLGVVVYVHALGKTYPLLHAAHNHVLPCVYLATMAPHHDLVKLADLLCYLDFELQGISLIVIVVVVMVLSIHLVFTRTILRKVLVRDAEDGAGVVGRQGKRGTVKVAATKVHMGFACRRGQMQVVGQGGAVRRTLFIHLGLPVAASIVDGAIVVEARREQVGNAFLRLGGLDGEHVGSN